jgi:integration host factor subunit beta
MNTPTSPAAVETPVAVAPVVAPVAEVATPDVVEAPRVKRAYNKKPQDPAVVAAKEAKKAAKVAEKLAAKAEKKAAKAAAKAAQAADPSIPRVKRAYTKKEKDPAILAAKEAAKAEKKAAKAAAKAAKAEAAEAAASEHNVSKREIVTHLYTKHSANVKQQDLTDIVEHTIEFLIESLAKGRDIELRNFGVLALVTRKSRPVRNPRNPTVEFMSTPKVTVKFKPGKELKRRLLEG